MIELYILLAILAFVMNLMPALMPPTWTVLAFVSTTYDLSFLPIIILGAIGATLGRVALANLSRSYIRPLLSEKTAANYAMLGNFLQDRPQILFPLIVAHAIIPFPTNIIYILLGLAKMQTKLFALSFFIGNILTYTFWLLVGHTFYHSLAEIFLNHVTQLPTILIEILSFVLLYALNRVTWKRFV